MIEIRELIKHFGAFEAVRGLSLSVAEGEVVGFLGPNGAGKTTTMRIIAGLLRATSGEVRLCGHDVQREPLAAKQLTSYIPDRPFLYDKLTAFEFLEFVGGLHHLTPRQVADGAERLLERFGLGRWADGLVEAFSHGMKQRLVFAAALLTDPRVLIVDEPMVGLDPGGARLVKTVLREQCERGCVLLSTHTMDVAEQVCDRIAIVSRGRIAAMGTMDELRSRADEPGSSLESIFLRLTEEARAVEAEAERAQQEADEAARA